MFLVSDTNFADKIIYVNKLTKEKRVNQIKDNL